MSRIKEFFRPQRYIMGIFIVERGPLEGIIYLACIAAAFLVFSVKVALIITAVALSLSALSYLLTGVKNACLASLFFRCDDPMFVRKFLKVLFLWPFYHPD